MAVDLSAPEVQEAITKAVTEASEKATAGLKGKNDELLSELKAFKAKAKSYEGIDPERYKQLAEAAEELERSKAKQKGDWDAREQQIREQMAAKHEKDKEPLTARATKLEKALERRLIQAELTAAIARAKGVPELLLPHATPHVRMRESDEDFVAFVADKDGHQRIGDAKGGPMNFDQLVEEMRQNPIFARAFEGTGSSGSGASSVAQGGGAANRIVVDPDNAIEMGKITNEQLKAQREGKLQIVYQRT